MTIDEFNEWMEQLDKYAKVLRDYGRLLTAIEDIKKEIEQVVVEEEAEDKRWSIGLHYALTIIDKHINREE